MTVRRLSLEQFRCFERAELEPGPAWNLVTGENASGKTSLLEALFFLGRGRSFRTGRAARLVREGADGFRLFARLGGGHRLGVERRGNNTRWRRDGEDLRRLAEIAEVFPVLAVDTAAQDLIEGGPGQRRRFLDWGLFHVEPGFLEVWRRYRQALSQRNRAVRDQGGGSGRSGDLAVWDGTLGEAGERLDALRQAQVERLQGPATEMAQQALGVEEVSLEYRSGWSGNVPLAEALAASRGSDIRMGHTLVGPHRAELRIRVDGKAARERISRGQQKVLAAAILLAGAAVFEGIRGRGVTLLVDDLPAELDAEHARRVGEMLRRLGGQRFVTGVDAERLASIAPEDAEWFHVKQGRIQSCREAPRLV